MMNLSFFLRMFRIESIDSPVAGIKNFNNRDLAIYNKLVIDLKKACERLKQENLRLVNHYVVFKEIANWECLEKWLKDIETSQPDIQSWAANWSIFILNIKNTKLHARTAHEAEAKTGNQFLAEKHLEETEKLLDEGKQKLKDDLKKDYLINDPHCAAILQFLMEYWASLEVFSKSDWCTTAGNSSDLFFQIFNTNHANDIVERDRHSATRAIFTISKAIFTISVDAEVNSSSSTSPIKDRSYVQASKIQVQMQPASFIKKSFSTRGVIPASLLTNNVYSYIKTRKDLSQQLNKIVEAAVETMNFHLAQGNSV